MEERTNNPEEIAIVVILKEIEMARLMELAVKAENQNRSALAEHILAKALWVEAL